LKSSKHQAPSSREDPNFKAPKTALSSFGAWCLVFLWSLELGVWSLAWGLSKPCCNLYVSRMKQLISLAVLCTVCTLNSLAADSKADAPTKSSEPVKIKADEAKKHAGEQAIVSGTVAEVNRSASLVRLNFEQPYPKSVFTAVIFNRNTN